MVDVEKVKEAAAIVDDLMADSLNDMANMFTSTKALNGKMRSTAFVQRITFARQEYEAFKDVKAILNEALKTKRTTKQ